MLGSKPLACFLWRKERAGVQRENPGEGGEDAPDEVVAMRAEWDEKLDPLVAKLETMRTTYMKKCEELGEGAFPGPKVGHQRAAGGIDIEMVYR